MRFERDGNMSLLPLSLGGSCLASKSIRLMTDLSRDLVRIFDHLCLDARPRQNRRFPLPCSPALAPDMPSRSPERYAFADRGGSCDEFRQRHPRSVDPGIIDLLSYAVVSKCWLVLVAA